MTIDPELLEILACPLCKTAVHPVAGGEALLCPSCRRRYAIVDDIPIMLVEEATIEEESEDHPDEPGRSRGGP